MPLLPGAEPFSVDAGPVGVVLSHGFTGSPASMRPWAQHLADAGYSVRLPRLPGHGTRWQDANATRWPDWYAEIERAYDELSGRCEQVFAAGLSMGGTLVTRLAEVKGDGVAGLILVNPAYGTERRDASLARYISWAVKSRPSIGGDIKKDGIRETAYDRTPVVAFVSLQKLWRVTVSDLAQVSAPVLLYRSRVDHVVEPLSGRLLIAGATSTTVREVILEDSYHVATLDNDAPTIFEGSVGFIAALRRESAAESVTGEHGPGAGAAP
ncbi:MAG TPA: alpha/beta fold hydrolase [Jatrophihabitantaceae bacterium]|nr:alpha/beta fold hydrolase [Jatrophihabitantaceae bacterium]